MDLEKYEQYKKEVAKKWLNENDGKSTLLSSGLMSMRPDLGFFIKVERFDIPEDIFPEEYKAITEAYFSVLEKLKEHYYKRTIKT